MASRVPEENSSSIVWTSEPFTAGRSTVGPNTVARFCRDILFSDSFSATLCTDQQTNTTTLHLTAVSFQVNLGQALPHWVLLYLFWNKTCGLVLLAFLQDWCSSYHSTISLRSPKGTQNTNPNQLPGLSFPHPQPHSRQKASCSLYTSSLTPAPFQQARNQKHTQNTVHLVGPTQQLDKVGNAHLSVGVVDINPLDHVHDLGVMPDSLLTIKQHADITYICFCQI